MSENNARYITSFYMWWRSPTVKGNLRSRYKLSSNEIGWKMQKWAITDLNAPNHSRDIPSQSQELEQNGRRHFVSFQTHFHVNLTSQTRSGKTMKKWEYNNSAVFRLICFKFCRLFRTQQRNFAWFQFRCYGNQIQNNCLSLKKQKAYFLQKGVFQKIIWSNTV